MRLATPLIGHVIEFNENKVSTLVIENQTCFYRLMMDLTMQAEGYEGDAVLSKDDCPIQFPKNAEIIQTFTPFTVNRKSLLTKICAAIEKEGLNESNFLRTEELLAQIERYIDDLSFGLPCSITFDKLNISSIIKSVGVVIEENEDEPIERIISYMELVSELESDKLFIFVNMRSYFADDKMNLFIKSATAHKHRIMLLDCNARAMLDGEQRWTVDEDWCEI
ncbi:MAG: type II-A CRISPR-associated protein Csn2 [Eubacteriales bacterium]|nr:type II-A CRISPR-associated protein Csn2 [Eubacteriales bacterium]